MEALGGREARGPRSLGLRGQPAASRSGDRGAKEWAAAEEWRLGADANHLEAAPARLPQLTVVVRGPPWVSGPSLQPWDREMRRFEDERCAVTSTAGRLAPDRGECWVEEHLKPADSKDPRRWMEFRKANSRFHGCWRQLRSSRQKGHLTTLNNTGLGLFTLNGSYSCLYRLGT